MHHLLVEPSPVLNIIAVESCLIEVYDLPVIGNVTR